MPEAIALYSPVPQQDARRQSLEKLLSQSPDDIYEEGRPARRALWRRIWPWALAAIYLILTLAVLLVTLRRGKPECQCAKDLSMYSPALEAVEYQPVLFNGSFRHPSEYRGYPNPEVDAAWERIMTDMRPMRITEEELALIGKEPHPSLVRYREEDGGGYMASTEFTHELHCLNSLRKWTYKEYYETFDPFFDARPDTIRTHLDHCIEMLRQNLMCIADVGMITYEWVEGYSHPYADFSTWHQCRNFENVLSWVEDHQLHIPKGHLVRLNDTVDLIEDP